MKHQECSQSRQINISLTIAFQVLNIPFKHFNFQFQRTIAHTLQMDLVLPHYTQNYTMI